MKKYRAVLPEGQGLMYSGIEIIAPGINHAVAAGRAAPYVVANAMIDIGESTPSNGYVTVVYRLPVEEYDDGR